MARKPEHYTAEEIWADLDRQHRTQVYPASDGWRSLKELAAKWGCSYSTATRRAERLLADAVLETAVRTNLQNYTRVYRPTKGPKKGG